ncbi:uncharacterized protein LOC133205798 [Saccostrea echinata]|uniref:uncharacterized protein LOC133205798 n=1 Tax=Saccostrea echinata TaxID=191078 RepID=UPI002A8026FC|nr:uncharacterized protein LOC133205798 [Saccostrea echinata]
MSGRHVCFVCGSLGAETGLRIKPHDRLPYFPFLEHHDPPKGARLPTSSGTVDCCRVCYAFLTQQWETYERSKTPAIKRLYWLKRADNGHFTGAEMRLQGEYIAQIMGLNYQPGVEGRASPDNNTRDYPPSPPFHKEERETPSNNHTGHREQSLSYKSDAKPQMKPKMSSQSVSLPREEIPVHHANVSSKGAQSEGVLDLTVRKNSKAKPVSLPSEKEQTIVCYICAQSTPVRNCKYVSTAMNSTSEPFFPVLQKISQPEGAFPLNQHGQAIVCGDCRLLLYQQWQAYELAGVPFQNRIYKLCDEKLKVPKSEPVTHTERLPKTPVETDEYVCYLCGKLYGSDLIRLLYTMPPHDPTMGTLFFPFVQELQRPKGAQPLKSDGSVLSCRNCYAELYHQWQVQESMQVPVYQRKYSLSFAKAGHRDDLQRIHVTDRASGQESKGSVVKSEATRPLNIHIMEGSSGSSRGSSQGLLAIAVSEEKHRPVMSSTSPSKLSTLLKRPFENLSSGTTIPHPLEQAVSKPKKICFLCGEKSRMMNTHVLHAYPVTHETKSSNTMVMPFFPFLTNSSPARGAETMTEEGTVIVCSICFHMLLKQWNHYEEFPNAETINRWHRRYVMPDFVCYICAKTTDRKNVKMLEAAKFPFLKDIKCPPDSLILSGGLLVIACKPCAADLNQQYAAYERLKLPINLRKYNWVQRTSIEEPSEQDMEPGEEEKESHSDAVENRDVDVEAVDDATPESGLQPGAKPPPLTTMMSPAASKLSRNTATVPPLNQVSPSNGVTSVSASAAMNATRTASFAAALRKLAHQAKDPEDPAPSHSSQPGSSSTSPRAVTPKRGPPPLVYNSHSTSLTSPPVVTIAPTQAHPTIPSTETKQSIERAHSVQSTASSVYEAMSLKQERERPQSTHSNRDDDRNSLKDLPLSRSRMTPLSGPSSSPAGLREDSVGRGFQPYRPGDDLRHQLPPSPFGLDPATAAAYSAAYPAAAFLPPHPFPHPAFRFDDPLLLERYRMMQPPYLPFGHPGMLPPPGVHPLLASGRYPPELLHQQFPFVSSSSRLPDHISPSLSERQRLEEERYREHEREKEREKELEREREKDKEILLREKEKSREKEKEFDKDKGHYYSHSSDGSRKERSGSLGGGDHHRLPRAEELGLSRFGSITQGTPKEIPHRKDSRSDKGQEPDRLGRDVHGERGSVPLPSNLEQSYKRDEKYSQLFSTGPKMSGDGQDIRYTQLHSLDRSASHSSTESRPSKSDSNFFRPFDTKTLTNGYHSGTSDVEKFSSSLKGLTDQRSKSDLHKHKHREDVPHSHHKTHNDLSSSTNHKLKQDKSRHGKSSVEDSRSGGHSVHTHSLLSSLHHQGDHSQKHKKSSNQLHSSHHHHHHSHESHQKTLRSRLDLEEQRLKRKRALDPYYTDSDEEEDTEELEKGRLLLITSGPSLPVDENPEKMKFLEVLGLTSRRIRKELDFERLRTRRRLHHERSVSPLELEISESSQGEVSNLPTPPQSVSDQMCQAQDFPEKCSFLNSFHLSVVDKNKKKELEQIKHVCEEDRRRRLSNDSQTGSKRRKIHLSDGAFRKQGKGRKSEGKMSGLMSLIPNRDACREFAEEFHQSVLLSTQRKALDMKIGNVESQSSARGSDVTDTEQLVPTWPGLAAVMQSYQNHLSEQITERKILKEKYKALKSQNIHLTTTAKALKQKESEMLSSKTEMNDKKLETQSAIDRLKRCLKDLH